MIFYNPIIKSLIVGLFLCSFFQGQGKIDGVVAIIGKNIILHSDVLQQSQVLALNKNIDPIKNPYLFENIYKETLDDIVNQYVILDIAEKDTNIIINGEDVDKTLNQKIDEFIQQAGSKENFENMVGMPLRKIKSEYWNEIKNMMYIEQYKGMKIQPINISRIEVLDFYKQYKDSIPIIPESYNYSIIEEPIIFGEKAKLNVIKILDSLKVLINNNIFSFDSLAKTHSEDPGSASLGGFLGYTSRGTLVQPYEEAAYSLEIGKISNPIQSKFGYHLIKLIDKRGEKISTQHILKTISITEDDYNYSFQKIKKLSNITKNDPFIFDSLAIISKNNYKNNSGTFINISPNNIQPNILKELKKMAVNNISNPVDINKSIALIYLYNHKKSYYPTPENSWNLIYEYALLNKQNNIFNQLIDNAKKHTYIKLLYN